MGLREFIDKIKGRSFIEGSQRNIPGGGFGESLNQVIETLLDPKNAVPLAVLDDENAKLGALAMGWYYAKDESDIEGFLHGFIDYYFITSGAVGGVRGKQIQDISIGQISLENQMQLMNVKHGGEVKELKGVM